LGIGTESSENVNISVTVESGVTDFIPFIVGVGSVGAAERFDPFPLLGFKMREY
jgi:hypothetical protein